MPLGIEQPHAGASLDHLLDDLFRAAHPAGVAEGERLEAARRPVLVEQPEQQHVELQHADGADDRHRPGDRFLIEDLHRPFLAQLPEPGVEVLAAKRIGDHDAREVLRREAGDAAEGDVALERERVGDAQVAAIENADHVARKRFLDFGAFTGEELLRLCQPERLLGARQRDRHPRLEAAGADAHEGDPIAVLRIHVRLDLEDEAGELRVGRLDLAAPVDRARQRPRRHGEEVVQERFDAEVGERRAEEHRRERPVADRLLVPRMARGLEQVEFVLQGGDGLAADRVGQRAVGERNAAGLDHRRAVVTTTIEEQHLAPSPVGHADEAVGGVHGPGHRVDVDPEVRLDVADQLERIAPGAVALVDEGEDRHPAHLADFEELPGPFLDATAIVEQHHCRVGCDQRPVSVLGEVGVAGGVEQVDLIAEIRELHHAGGHRDAALLLERHPVRRGMPRGAARLDRPREVDRAAVQEELLRQRRLAGVGVRNDREGASAGDQCRQRLGGQVSHRGAKIPSPPFRPGGPAARLRPCPPPTMTA